MNLQIKKMEMGGDARWALASEFEEVGLS